MLIFTLEYLRKEIFVSHEISTRAAVSNDMVLQKDY